MALLIIGGEGRRSIFTMEEKALAVKAIFIDHTDARKYILAMYEKAGKDAPKNTSVVIANWRAQLQAAIDAGNAEVIAMCKRIGIVKDGERKSRRK